MSVSYVNVIPLAKLGPTIPETLTYILPQEYASRVRVGSQVQIPLGRRTAQGVVVQLHAPDPALPKRAIKSIHGLGNAPYTVSAQALELAGWIASQWICPISSVLELSFPKVRKNRTKKARSKGLLHNPSVPALTKQQDQALQSILHASAPTLLWGVTGSGKTEVYIRLIASMRVRQPQSQQLVLVPEIGMVPQMEQRLQERFGAESVLTIHSKKSTGERAQAFARIASGKPCIVVGTRSALFVPFTTLTTVIVDECHDASYCSWDKQPRYDGRAVAEKLAQVHGARLVFGSATPQTELIYRAQQGEVQLVSLSKKVFAQPDPTIEVVDLRRTMHAMAQEETSLSYPLQEALTQTVAQGRQAVLFVNRRGAATVVLCSSCGQKESCPTCDVPLVHHLSAAKDVAKRNRLVCHHCNYHAQVPSACTQCGAVTIRFGGVGTERVELDVKSLLPQARVARLDADTTTKKHAHAHIYEQLQQGTIDVLIGTQMVSKGLDLPAVDLVGIVQADTLLNLPDIRSEERTYQVLTQVSGRAGRRKRAGMVVLQTYEPEHPIIQAVANRQAECVYERELAGRRASAYPPFSRLVRLLVEEHDPAQAVQKANAMRAWLNAWSSTHRAVGSGQSPILLDILGPAPAFFVKARGKTRIHLLVKVSKRGFPVFARALRAHMHTVRIFVDPDSVL